MSVTRSCVERKVEHARYRGACLREYLRPQLWILIFHRTVKLHDFYLLFFFSFFLFTYFAFYSHILARNLSLVHRFADSIIYSIIFVKRIDRTTWRKHLTETNELQEIDEGREEINRVFRPSVSRRTD